MKKYLLGIFAIAMAVVLYSFTTNKYEKSNNTKTTEYYWFLVDSEGQINPEDDPIGPMSVVEFQGEYEDCTGNGPRCAEGFETTLPTSPNDIGDETLLKD